jgi:hypothetical protein
VSLVGIEGTDRNGPREIDSGHPSSGDCISDGVKLSVAVLVLIANSGELVSCRGISIGPVPPHEPLKLVWCAVSGPTQLGTKLDSGGELSYLSPKFP